MSARLIDPLYRVTDSSGVPLNGALLYVYEAGTTTPLATYSNSGLSVANANPVVSDSTGYFGDVFVAADDYKWILKDADLNTLKTSDDIAISAAPTFSLTSTTNAQTGISYTLQTTDRAKLVTFSNASTITLTVPQADSANFPDGFYTDLANKGAGTVVVTPNTSTVDGLATFELTTGQSVRIVSDGTNYQITHVAGKDSGVNAQTGTTYTINTSDRKKLVTFSNSSTVAVIMPQANTTTFKDGWWCEVENKGAGVVTITPTTSTINGGLSTLVLTRGQRARIVSDGTNYQSVTYGEAVGNVKFGYSATAPQGYLLENGDTIGSASSGATKAGAIYEALYHYYWNAITDTYAPVSTGRGASAVADFAANKTLTILDNDKRVPYGAGTSTTGETNGAATVASTGSIAINAVTLSEANLPTGLTVDVPTGNVDDSEAPGSKLARGDVSAGAQTTPVTLGSVGSGSSFTPTGTYTGDATSVNQLGRVIYWYVKY